MLYIKPYDQITWNDIDDFCKQKIAEGPLLDYKRDFPQELEKTIAAMANTFGGIVLIGVKADKKENKPVLPLSGIEFQEGLSERVTNIDLSNITPPVLPEIKVCPNPNNNQLAIVMIRIHQSHQTPHAIARNTKVYIRTNDRNKPETLASLDQIAWLQDQRRKSIELRENLYKRANARYDHFNSSPAKAAITIATCPYYPKRVFLSPPELKRAFGEIRVFDYYATNTYFPVPDKDTPVIVQDGIILNTSRDEYEFYHTELNCFGLYFYAQTIAKNFKGKGKKIGLIREDEILCRIEQFLESAAKYYRLLGYWGDLNFRVHLGDLRGHLYGPHKDTGDDPRFQFLTSPDSEVLYSEAIHAASIEDEQSRLILESAQRIGWAFGRDLTQKSLEKFFKTVKS